MPSEPSQYHNCLQEYFANPDTAPLILCGDILRVLNEIPNASIDCCITSPPYWNKRQYHDGGIGLEDNYNEYVEKLLEVFFQLYRVLKNTGSFWLNIGDSYCNKKLLGIPWRIAIRMMDEQGWVLRNEVIWNKVKGGPDNSKDKLGNIHEQFFHFVKNAHNYYYDSDSIRNKPNTAKVIAGAVVSATGVVGIRYKRQIELSTSLSELEKENALKALAVMMENVRKGAVSDFRMVIRGQQRTTHSDSTQVSGRAKELQEKGFYFLKYNPKGSKPRDVWDILPITSHSQTNHYAAYPPDLCKIPILATCPVDGIILDPFMGTGTTNWVAKQLHRKSIGIDISADYVEYAKQRCQ